MASARSVADAVRAAHPARWYRGHMSPRDSGFDRGARPPPAILARFRPGSMQGWR